VIAFQHKENDKFLWKPVSGFLLFLFAFLAGIPACIFSQTEKALWCDSSKILNNRGADYYMNGEWDLARADLLKAIDYTLRCNPQDSFDLIPALLNLVGLYAQTWQYDKALELIHRAENIYKTSGVKNQEYLSFIDIRAGRIYSATGDYSKAEEYYTNALLLHQEIKTFSDINKTNIINLYNGLGVLNKRMKKYSQAIEQYNRAVEISLKIEPSYLTYLYGNIANAYREMKQYNLSEEYFERAVAREKVIHKQDSIDLAILLTDYSGLLLDLKKPVRAKPVIEKAQALCYGIWGSRNPQLAEVQVNMGKYHELLGQFDKALYWYQQSVLSLYTDKDIYLPGTGTLPKNIISRQHLLVSLKSMARLYRMKYSATDSIVFLKKSLSTYEHCIMLAEIIRRGYLNDDSRLFLAENEKATLNEANGICREMFARTSEEDYLYKAFEFSERSKSALLLSSIQSNSAISVGGIPETIGHKEKDLLRQISVTEETIYEEEGKSMPDAQKLLKWENTLLNLKRDYEILIDSLEKEYPRYYELKYRSSLIQQKDLAGILAHGYNLVEYNMEDSLVSIFVLNRKGIHCLTMPLDEKFNTALEGILKQLQNFDPTQHKTEHFRLFCTFSYTLYKTLFKPIEKYLISDKVILVPDEILSYLPFEILLSKLPEDQTMDYRNLSYLLKKYSLGYSYSASLLVNDPQKKDLHRNRKVLAMAPAYHGKVFVDGPPFGSQTGAVNLNPLPGAYDEVFQVTKILKGRKLIDSMATEKAFKKFAPDYGILHLAMHTLIDNRNPMFSKLVFTPWLTGPDEGLLNTYELYNMKLHARMVVLSACRSGDGMLQKGEGIMSLARGFLYAGCPSLVMTLWNVEDRSGLEIMHHFYHQIKKGKGKNEALRKAKIKYLNSAAPHKTHPYYWAGYLQIGEPEAIFAPWYLRFLPVILIPVLMILLISIWQLRKRKKKRFSFQKNPSSPDPI
jgi:CHAT domain-containing protein/Tfp pilus assembly protein PilF